MIDFKIVKGGFYRTRDGRKVECLKDDLKSEVYTNIITDGIFCWTASKCGMHSVTVPCIEDIVGVWEDPKPKRLCYRNKDSGTLYMLNEDELIGWKKNSIERHPCALDEI